MLGPCAGTGHSGISREEEEQCLGVRTKEWKWPLWEAALGQYSQNQGGWVLRWTQLAGDVLSGGARLWLWVRVGSPLEPSEDQEYQNAGLGSVCWVCA